MERRVTQFDAPRDRIQAGRGFSHEDVKTALLRENPAHQLAVGMLMNQIDQPTVTAAAVTEVLARGVQGISTVAESAIRGTVISVFRALEAQ